MQLHEWQRAMQTAVVSGQDHPRLSLRTSGIDRRTGLGIYQYAYRARLLEALQCNFPALHRLLGDDHFALAGHGFRHQHPPTHASIRWFGNGFSDYLAETSPFSDCPAMAELARFEWALRHTIDAADAQRIETQDLQAVAPEQWHSLLFDLHPSLQLLCLDWNVPFIWQALMDEQTPPPPESMCQTWLVYRQPDRVSAWRSVEEGEAAALEYLAAGNSFGALCERLWRESGDADAAVGRAAVWLRTWVEQGLLTVRATADAQ
ncbi:MAG: DNA-binding domain-containing protein [Candidatus Thiodiazotropha sp.]